MLDPKILLEALLAGAAKPASGPAEGRQAHAVEPATAVDLGEILRRLGGAQAPGGGQPPGGGGGLSDILEKLGRAGGQQPQAPGSGGAGGRGGGLEDILGEILGRAGQSRGGAREAPGGPSFETGGRMGMPGGDAAGGGQQGPSSGGRDLLEEIFGPQGGRRAEPTVPPAPPATDRPWGQPADASRRAGDGYGRGGYGRDEAIDARRTAEELLAAIAAGRGTPEMIEQLKDMVARGHINAGAVIGGLGALVVGNKPGRRINADAVRMGGLELIGAIAYSSYAAYRQGRSPSADPQGPAGPAPAGSGFEAEAQSSDAALLYVRAMIAAAVADGQVDRGEQQQIVGSLASLGLGQHATQFLQQEFESPPTIDDLVQATGGSPAMALQAYTAARLAIEPDTREEQAFLQALADAVGIDASLAAHIDAQASSLKV